MNWGLGGAPHPTHRGQSNKTVKEGNAPLLVGAGVAAKRGCDGTVLGWDPPRANGEG